MYLFKKEDIADFHMAAEHLLSNNFADVLRSASQVCWSLRVLQTHKYDGGGLYLLQVFPSPGFICLMEEK